MPFEGKQLMAREICVYIEPLWPTAKVQGVACTLGESLGFVGAFNDNVNTFENVVSRDCGPMQISVLSEDIAQAEKLMTTSKDFDVYDPIVKYNVLRGRRLYDAPMLRNGKLDKRRWQPWVAVTTGWAWHPEFWVWAHGVGPWAPTGRFMVKAIRGVANWHLLTKQDKGPEEALETARKLAELFKVKCEWLYSEKMSVYYKIPPKPTAPPKDGIGPRPIPNDGIWVP